MPVLKDHKGNNQPAHSNQDRYLITYADLITLLLGLFVILYASSQVDGAKYQKFAAAVTQYFKPEKQVHSGNGIMPGTKGIPQPILPSSQEKTLDNIDQKVEHSLAQDIKSGVVSVERTAEGLSIRLSERLLFESGKDEIRSEALPSLDSVANILQGIRQQILVQGYTDSIPIHTFQFESNWHLSVARALNVGYYCMNKGVPEQNVSISGFGAQRPIADNTTPEGRARNRRVEILIKELPVNIPSTEGYLSSDTAQSADTHAVTSGKMMP